MIAEQTHIKSGYKKTPVGIIPEEWDVKPFKSFAKFYSGGTPVTSNREYYGGDIPFIRSGEINKNKTELFISEKGLNNSSAKLVSTGDILYALYGANSGEVSISQINGAINQAILCIITEFDKTYILNYLINLKSTIISKYLQGGQGNLSADIIKSLKIPLPPLPEQQKIAYILSTWDEAIAATKTLIVQTKKRNQGLAQLLITGKKRLKGFDGKWERLKISDFSNDISLKNKEDKDLIVLSCTKHHGLVPSLEYFGRKIYSENLDTYKIVARNCFAYATNHIEEGSIGYQDKYDSALISPMYTVFKTNEKINDSFLYKVLKSHAYIHEYQKRMEGSIDRRGGLRWDEFSKIKVSVPSLEEQKAINEILEIANQELKTLEQKLKSLVAQKKGLMQKLLTGEIRVKIN